MAVIPLAPIGIIAALPIEARILSKKKLAIGETIILPNQSLLQVAGMGAECARQAAQHLISRGASALISWGTAAGLAPGLRPGQLLLPDKIIAKNHAMYPVTQFWRDRLQQALSTRLTVANGQLLQVDKILTAVADKQYLFAQYQAAAADMESAAIAAAAQQADLPFLVIRSIIDTADFTFPAWLQASLDCRGVIKPYSLIKKICRHPKRLLTLLQLARDFSAAQHALGIAAEYLT